MSYSLIVFDWDGTLIDSAGTIVDCIQQASADLRLEVPDRSRASHVIGLGLKDSLRLAVPGLPAERYAEFVELYRRHFMAREDAIRLFPGIEALLKTLSQTRLLAIATGKSRRGLERALRASGLRSEEHTSELQSPCNLVCRLLLEKKKKKIHLHLER